ncbi:YegP family protein [Polaromonas sp. YR568]|uniref:YegP family protein n=1 Tax=Polaromonas sp. YR568 TaxID=1855301 RepID=UPI00398BCC6A
MQYQLYPVTVNGGTQWRWRLVAGNNRVIASGESYFNRQDCVDVVNLIMDTNRQTPFVETVS